MSNSEFEEEYKQALEEFVGLTREGGFMVVKYQASDSEGGVQDALKKVASAMRLYPNQKIPVI